MNDLAVSIIRTVVPTVVGAVVAWLVFVGAVVAWLVARGINIDDTTAAQLVAALTAVLTAVYYAVARLAERKWPNAGWLLGTPKQPSYSGPTEDELQ